MQHPIQPTLLLIGVTELPTPTSTLDLYAGNTIRETMATLRLINFDLLLVGLENQDLDVWNLMSRVLSAWPSQKWIFAGEGVTPRDEVQARSLGALMVLNQIPNETWLADYIATLRHRGLRRSFETPVPADVFATSPNFASVTL